MDMIEEYIELTKACSQTDYSDKKSVRNHNKSVNRMYEIVESIGREDTSASINDFNRLLDISENGTNVWAAVHMLERLRVDSKTESKALQIIKQIAKGDSAEAMGFQSWLDDYKNKL